MSLGAAGTSQMGAASDFGPVTGTLPRPAGPGGTGMVLVAPGIGRAGGGGGNSGWCCVARAARQWARALARRPRCTMAAGTRLVVAAMAANSDDECRHRRVLDGP